MPSGKELTAGSFFYGMRYPIPDDKLISDHVRNKKLFCIPSIEPFDDQKEVKAQMAEDWLAAVMSEAKRCGMSVQFSTELRDQTMEDSLAAVDAIIKIYPMIDNLELITQETGSDRKQDKSAEEMGKLVESYFGPDAMKDPELSSLITGGGKCLTGIINEVGHNTQVAKKLKEMWGSDPTKPQLSVGVYISGATENLKIAERLIQLYLPADIYTSAMVDYGSRASAKTLTSVPLNQTTWNRMMLYGWIEFDGVMFLQENDIQGIHEMLGIAEQGNGGLPVHGFSLNHWRTSENRTTIRYVSEALIDSTLTPEAFYAESRQGARDR